jgi:hypothetical protein
LSFLKNFFSIDSTVNPAKLVDLVESKISNDMNEALCKQFTTEEISNTLFQVRPLKAPSPDGFPARFY